MKFIDPEIVRREFTYNPFTGEIRNKITGGVGGIKYSGTSSSPKPYIRIRVGDSNFYVHRVIWVWMTGEQPEGEVDHKDSDGLNNRWVNLRDLSHRRNGKNQKIHSNNTSGVGGVTQRKNGRWRARIMVEGKMVDLGSYIDKQDAIDRRMMAEQKYKFGVHL